MKRIRVGIIGQGRSGRDIHGNYLSTDHRRFKIVAAVDPLKQRRDRARQEYGCEVYLEHLKMLERDDLDLVVNAAPSHLHVPITMDCLNAGFNTLCEKPLAQRVKDVDRMAAAANKHGKLLAVFPQSRYAPYFRQVRKIIGSGVLGEVIQIAIAFNGFSRRYDWQTLKEFMGGNLLNTGPHPLDQALQLFGDAMPEVNCLMRRVNTYGDAEDHVVLLLSGENRPIIHLEISSCSPYNPYTYQVSATRGGLIGTMTEMEWRYYDSKQASRLKLRRKPLSKPDGTPSYCTDSLKWRKRSWKLPKAKANMFEVMSSAYYRMLHRALTRDAQLEVTVDQVRRQIAVIEECQRQNPQIYG